MGKISKGQNILRVKDQIRIHIQRSYPIARCTRGVGSDYFELGPHKVEISYNFSNLGLVAVSVYPNSSVDRIKINDVPVDEVVTTIKQYL